MSLLQARNVRTNEVVAIKKMSYSGKQSQEVCTIEFLGMWNAGKHLRITLQFEMFTKNSN